MGGMMKFKKENTAKWNVGFLLITVFLFSELSFPNIVRSSQDMVEVPAGEFTMGLDENELQAIVDELGGIIKYHFNATPKHKVNLPTFYIDKFEVTNEEYKKFVDATKHAPPEEGWEDGNYPSKAGKKPVVFINWNDAKAFCEWKGKRLPTEAEWEKAARGNDGRLFPWGKRYKRKKYANTNKERKRGTTNVGSFKQGVSPSGCFDMAGNVWEWTASFYKPYPGNSHDDEFYGEERYVVRGGSFLNPPYDVLTTNRSKFTPVSADENIGFRCAKSP